MTFSRHNRTLNDADLFEIPEIIGQIAGYLNINELATCINVSKAWYQLFISPLWKKVDIRNPNWAHSESVLSKHAHFIKSLSIGENPPAYILNLRFPALKEISIAGQFARKYVFSPLLLSNNPTIEDLSIYYGAEFPDNDEAWEVLSNLLELKKLKLSCIKVTPKSINAFWRTIGHIEKAELNGISVPDDFCTQSTSPLKLRTLKISKMGKPGQQQEFIEKLTGLEYLHWHSFIPGADFVKSFQEINWPNLHQIVLYSVPLKNIQLQQILNSISRLTQLNVNEAKWGPESFHALSRFFGTLENFLSREESFTSVMVNILMCSCPNLRQLKAKILYGVDILGDSLAESSGPSVQEWICTRLETLSIRFDLQDINSQIPILERIANLKQLTHFHLMEDNFEAHPTITISLGSGLDILKSLRRLRFVTIPGINHSMTEVDIEWILNNWKNLECLYGRLNYDGDQNAALRKILESRGVRELP
ncbi:hypothetical protein BGZ76_005823 [Entomortierella beljakovae]|nr:hypothetical protein BGZ76_005823 [Entomortierella beljakovae]